MASAPSALPRGICWGSFERNTGTWTPYSTSEQQQVEEAFARGAESVTLPSCFGAVVHFASGHGGQHHFQRTPAVGSKPPGFRSVLRGVIGEEAKLYWWGDQQLWRLDGPERYEHEQTVLITALDPAAGAATAIWQWCDLPLERLAEAREQNWHRYGDEDAAAIEGAWSRRSSVSIMAGLTTYDVGSWQGVFGIQVNTRTNYRRQVRRGRLNVSAETPEALQDEMCPLCTESFADHPEWPVRKTSCGHSFHWTCLQPIMQESYPRCPICRTALGSGARDSTPAYYPDSYPRERW